jgi:carbon-monoxide dehydrogenase large subunit
VFTNTVPVDAYRGAGQPEAIYVVERLVETAARELRVDPVELRRRNFITRFPYATPVGLVYDIGDYGKTLDSALKRADVAGFAKRKYEAERRGKRRGLGYSCYIGAGGSAPSHVVGALGGRAGLFESGEVRVHPTGKVTVFTGSHSHGQGHETTYAQIVADRLGIPIEDVDIVHGDTGRVLFGMGTYGSRSLAIGGTAIVKALDKVVAKGRKIAAHLMEAAEGDIAFEDGKFSVAGTDKQIPFAQVALAAYLPHNYPHDKLEPGLNEQAFYDPVNCTFPAGTHICEVEVDPETGAVEIVRYTAVDDFGNLVNPAIVAGQVHGGVAQGIGQALLEECRYDARTGQLINGSFLDYAMPRAADLPHFDLGTEVTLCTHNPLGVKGCGESGAIAAPAAVMNALTDALAVRDLRMPATPERVWRALHDV